jgi:aminopeptidase-like protein
MIKSIKKINEEYDGEWIFMINCREDENGNLIEGEVVLNSRSRDEIFRKMVKYQDHPSMFSIRFAGDIPEGVNVVL